MIDAKARLANRERQRKYREAHREEINEQRKKRYNERIKNGKCPRCGEKAKKGFILCAGCSEYQASLNRKYSKQRKKNKVKSGSLKTPAKKTPAKKPASKKTPAKNKTKKKYR